VCRRTAGQVCQPLRDADSALQALISHRLITQHAMAAFNTYSGADSKELEELRQTHANLTQRLLDTTTGESQAHQRLADLNELLRRKNDECKRRADRCGRAHGLVHPKRADCLRGPNRGNMGDVRGTAPSSIMTTL